MEEDNCKSNHYLNWENMNCRRKSIDQSEFCEVNDDNDDCIKS